MRLNENEAKMNAGNEVRKAVTNYDISDHEKSKFLFSCVFTKLRSKKAVLPQSDSHSPNETRVFLCAQDDCLV
jgi:hypothetical protein